MIDTQAIENEMLSVQKDLENLSLRHSDLQKQLKVARELNMTEELQEWGISDGSCLAMFAKNDDEFYSIKTYYIYSLCRSNMSLSCIKSVYTFAQDELYYNVYPSTLNFSELIHQKLNYNICVIDDVQLVILQQALCQLKIDHKTFNNYVETFLNRADKRIS